VKTHQRRHFLIGIAVVLAVGLIAAVSFLTRGAPQKAGAQADSALVGHHVRNFSLGGLKGGTIRAPWESGHASVLVFFASYCGPCQGEMPKIASYLRTHSPSPVEVLGIDAIDERSSAQAMIKRDDVTFPVGFDPNGVVTTGDFGFAAIPESVFVGSNGVVKKVFYGAIPEQRLAIGIAMLKGARS
jgi:thiol-disulfide isomerase/thioredoxin